MNNLIYNARMALRDIMEVNIYSQGNDRVYVEVSPTFAGDGPGEVDMAVVDDVINRLRDMDMILAGGNEAVKQLLAEKSVEVLRKAA